MATRIDITPTANGKPLSDPAREYVVGGSLGGFSGNGGFVLAQVYDDIVRTFGSRVYELMELDSAIAAALWMLQAGTIGDGLLLSPKIQAEPGKVVSRRGKRRDIKLAGEIFEAGQRAVDGLGDGVMDQALVGLLAGLTRGCKLAEQVFTLSEEGEDRGKQMPTVFDVKPNWAWAFNFDRFMRVRSYRCWTAEDGWADVEPSHFTRFTWRPVDGDLRGSTVLRPAYSPFNLMMQAYPDYGEYLRKFASASLVLTAGPNAEDKYYTDPTTGQQVPLTVAQQMVNAGLLYRQHSILGLLNGQTAQLIQSQGTGQAFLNGFDFFERQMFRAVILSTRPMQEAKHGSKADAESGLDIFGMAVASVRETLAGCVRGQFLRRWVELNWGPEVAKRLTPEVRFGASDHISPDLMRAFADAWSKGLFDEEHRPFIWGKVGAPVPDGWQPDPGATRPGQAPSAGPAPAPEGPPPAENQGPPPGKPTGPGGPSSTAPPPQKKGKTPSAGTPKTRGKGQPVA